MVGIATLLAVSNASAAAPPFSQGQPYRHGVVPPRSLVKSAPTAPAASSYNLKFGGGVNGVGVTTGAPRVYLVFWGSQWGPGFTNADGDVVLEGDSAGEAPVLQEFFKGIGTGGETWSGVMTQYCQGVAVGSQTCPASAPHVGYPTGGALAGVWVDEASAEPGNATAKQIAQEAIAAAGHFGNTTSTSNRNAQYVIVSPTGTHPDGFPNTGFCAWHDYTGESYLGVSSPYGELAFTNFPYVVDAGQACGQSYVNAGSAGKLDGVTMVEGHEYAETITDQFPSSGWTDSALQEDADKCTWIGTGGDGGAQNITLTTGTFVVQGTWANDGSGGSGTCEVSHPIITNPESVTVTNPGSQSATFGKATSLQIQASDTTGETLTYSATGLPPGLALSSSSGRISGTPTAAGTYQVTVTATASGGASDSASFTWTIAKASQTITFTSQPPANPVYGGSYDVSATGGASGNPVVFSIDASSDAGTCSVSGSTVSFTGAGLCVIDANQAGNSNYAAASQVQQKLTIAKASQTITFTSQPPANPVYGGSYDVSATGGASGNPVVFSVDSSSDPGVCSVAGSTVSFTGVGTCVIDANQAGNANYNPAPQVQQQLAIARAPQSISWAQQGPFVYGTGPVQLTAQASSGLPVSYSVQSGPCTVSGSTLTITGAGTCQLAAGQSGNENYLPAGAVTQQITIDPAPTRLSPAPAKVGLLQITFSATLTSQLTGQGIAGQTVSFSMQGQPACRATTNTQGVATCSINGLFLVLGSGTYTATYAGSGNYGPSTATGKY